MGSITATGSVIAYGKLSGHMSSTALALPGRDYINMGLVRVVCCVFCCVELGMFFFALNACLFEILLGNSSGVNLVIAITLT